MLSITIKGDRQTGTTTFLKRVALDYLTKGLEVLYVSHKYNSKFLDEFPNLTRYNGDSSYIGRNFDVILIDRFPNEEVIEDIIMRNNDCNEVYRVKL